MLFERAINLLHPRDKRLHLVFQTPVFRNMFGTSGKLRAFQQGFFCSEMFDAMFEKPSRLSHEEGPTCPVIDQ